MSSGREYSGGLAGRRLRERLPVRGDDWLSFFERQELSCRSSDGVWVVRPSRVGKLRSALEH